MVRSNTFLFVLLYSILLMICSAKTTAQIPAVDLQTSSLSHIDVGAGCNADSQEIGLGNGIPLVYDKIFFNRMALCLNKAAPYDAGYGMTVFSVTMEGNSINFTLTCDYSIYLCLTLLEYDIDEDFKYELAMGLFELFDAMGCDDNGDSIETKMKSLGLEFNYSLYVTGYQETVASIKITGEDLIGIYELNNGIFSV